MGRIFYCRYIGPYYLVWGCRLQPPAIVWEEYSIVDIWDPIVWFRVVDFNPSKFMGRILFHCGYEGTYYLVSACRLQPPAHVWKEYSIVDICDPILSVIHLSMCLFISYLSCVGLSVCGLLFYTISLFYSNWAWNLPFSPKLYLYQVSINPKTTMPHSCLLLHTPIKPSRLARYSSTGTWRPCSRSFKPRCRRSPKSKLHTMSWLRTQIKSAREISIWRDPMMCGGYPWVVVLGLPKKKVVTTKAMGLAMEPLGSRMQPSWSQTRCGTVMPLRLYSQWNGVFLDWCPFGPKWCSSEKWTCPQLGAVSCFRDFPTQTVENGNGITFIFWKNECTLGIVATKALTLSQRPLRNMGDWGPIQAIWIQKNNCAVDPGPPCSSSTGFEPLKDRSGGPWPGEGKMLLSHPCCRWNRSWQRLFVQNWIYVILIVPVSSQKI